MSYPKIFLRQGIGFRSIRWEELVLLMDVSLLTLFDVKDFKYLLLPFQTIIRNSLPTLKISTQMVGYLVENFASLAYNRTANI